MDFDFTSMPLVIHLALHLSQPVSRNHMQILYWSIFMIVTCYAHLILIAKNQWRPVTSMSILTDNSMGHLLYLPKQYLMPCQSQQQTRQTSCLIADWTTTWKHGQLLMILTNTAQCRPKGMITPSVSKNCIKYRYTPQIKIWAFFRHQNSFVIQLQMNNQGSMWNKSKKIDFPGSKTIWCLIGQG